MCGIVGITYPLGKEEAFQTALDKLEHRGPDGYGIWTSPNKEVKFGHRRLAIIDLSDGAAQPMHWQFYSIIFNGEIFNYRKIRLELEHKGYTFKTDSDTEVILIAFAHWGERCLEKFNGMWALAIWNDQEKKLFLARDRYGEKPLFYSFIDESLVFASEMKAITPFMQKRNLKISDNFFWCKNNTWLYEATEKTLIDQVYRFPAGHYAYYKPHNDPKKIIFKSYWNTLESMTKYNIPKDYHEQCEYFRELLMDACRLRLVSDVPVGTALSGGLDSSLITSIISSLANKKKDAGSNFSYNTFIASFSNSTLDETTHANKVIGKYNLSAHFIDINKLDTLSILQRSLYYFEELYITSPVPMAALYSHMREQGISVTIDGHGADELLGGYSFSLDELILEKNISGDQLEEIFQTKARLSGQNVSSVSLAKEKIKFYTKINGTNLYHLVNKASIFKDKYKMPIKRHDNYKELGAFNSHLYSLTHSSILPTLLRNYDRYSMMHGVEIRMPFLDHRVVSYLLALPWDSKIRRGYNKAILRDAFQDLLPVEIARRSDKIGFNSPINEWMKTIWKEFLLDTISSQEFNSCSLINPKKVRQQIHKCIYNSNSNFREAELAWSVLMPFLWEKYFLKEMLKDCS